MYKHQGTYREGISKRIAGYSDEQMLKQCEITYGVANTQEEYKVGRGKNAKIMKRHKYDNDPVLLESLKKSIDHYSNLIDNPSKIKFRDYQREIIRKGSLIMLQHNFLYLSMEVRTGKTLTSLGICNLLNRRNVLFLTKKKAMSSISEDYLALRPDFDITIINYESLHKVEDVGSFDTIICDEAHGMGAFPKPSGRAKQVGDIIKKYNTSVILLSGTPTPESYSQMYHQVYRIKNNPFNKYVNFYKFAKDYVNVKQRKINGLFINDYHDALPTVLDAMKPYTIAYSQKEAGFKVDTREHILCVDMSETTYKLVQRLKKDRVIEGKDEVVLADTPVKLMSKLHQLYSGTVKFESGKSKVIDDSKARFIKEKFKGKKIGIFYKFKAELDALKSVFEDTLVTDLEKFTGTGKSIALQIVSGREGISLREADALVYYNIDFSATSYWQSRDRMTTKDRLESDIYWIFAERGIEHDIYKAVSKKKDYTVNHFKKDLLSLL